MSLKIEDHSDDLKEFEEAVNDEETAKRIGKAFSQTDKKIKKDIAKAENKDIILDVVRAIRRAKNLEEAKQVLIDNCVSLYNAETIAAIIQYSLIEGPNPINLEDDPEWRKSFDEEFCSGEIGKGKYEDLTEDQVYELFSKAIFLHDGITEVIYTEKSGKMYTLDENGNKVYKDEEFVNRFKNVDQLLDQSENISDVLKDALTEMIGDPSEYNVTLPADNIVRLTKKDDDFCKFMVRASKGYSQTIIQKRKEEVIASLEEKNILTPEIKEAILSCTAVYEIEEIYNKYKDQPVETKKEVISKSTQDHVDRFMTRLHNGDFDEEYAKRRQAEIGYGEPLDLTKEGIAKEVEKFGETLNWLAEVMPEEFGPADSKTTSEQPEKGTSRKRKKSSSKNGNK